MAMRRLATVGTESRVADKDRCRLRKTPGPAGRKRSQEHKHWVLRMVAVARRLPTAPGIQMPASCSSRSGLLLPVLDQARRWCESPGAPSATCTAVIPRQHEGEPER